MFLKNPAALPAIDEFIFKGSPKGKVLEKAVYAVTNIPGEAAQEVLARVLTDVSFQTPARKLALQALVRAKSESSQRLLAAFVSFSPDDPLAAEAKRALAPPAS